MFGLIVFDERGVRPDRPGPPASVIGEPDPVPDRRVPGVRGGAIQAALVVVAFLGAVVFHGFAALNPENRFWRGENRFERCVTGCSSRRPLFIRFCGSHFVRQIPVEVRYDCF